MTNKYRGLTIPLIVIIIIILILFLNANQHLIKRPIENKNAKIIFIGSKNKPPLEGEESHHFEVEKPNGFEVENSTGFEVEKPNSVLEYLGERASEFSPEIGGPLIPSRPNLYDLPPGNGPVPRGALKATSEKYKAPFYSGSLINNPPQAGFAGIGSMTPLTGFGGIPPASRKYTSFPTAQRPLKGFDYFRPFGPNPAPERIEKEASYADIPFYSSTDAYAPLPEINTKWEKMGIVSTTNEADDSIMNLYRRPIAPLQDLWEYSVQDKNGFVLRLKNTNFLENNDTIPYIEGKQNKGSWKVTDYVKDKYVLM